MPKLETLESLINSLNNAALKMVLNRALEAARLNEMKYITLGAILTIQRDDTDFKTISELHDLIR